MAKTIAELEQIKLRAKIAIKRIRTGPCGQVIKDIARCRKIITDCNILIRNRSIIDTSKRYQKTNLNPERKQSTWQKQK